MEKILNIAQCTEREKVLYASGRLTGLAVDWWYAYCTTCGAADTITWVEFSTNFRNYHIPVGFNEDQEKIVSLTQARRDISERVQIQVHPAI
jgi:hypothetical protein